MTWKLNHCPDSVVLCPVHQPEEGSRSCNWEYEGQGPLTLGQPKLLYNTITNVGNQHLYFFTSLTAPSARIRTLVRAAVSAGPGQVFVRTQAGHLNGLSWRLGLFEQPHVSSCIFLSPSSSCEGEDCDEKSRKH